MSEIKGVDNEYEFVKYLNGKKINELNPMFRELIDSLHFDIDENPIIKCWRNHYKQKSDIIIKINNKMKGISIKKGSRNSVHVEPISSFINFLINNKIEKEIILEYLKYHYADGSTNGKGNKRLSAEEYKINNQESIDKINKTLNNELIISKAIERFVTKGTNSNYSIDALIYGEVNDFLLITCKDIKNIIMSKKDIYSSAIHFGSLTCQPKNRCLNYNKKYEKDRFCVQIKWYSLFDDIIQNMNNKVINANKKN